MIRLSDKFAYIHHDIDDAIRGRVLTEEEIPMEFVRAALSSVADTAIIPVQDYLGLGKEARINTPSTLGNNWKWRMLEGEITPELTARIRRMTKLYGRLA